eukprot:scaffold73425_cov57-Phaeocystis_antarctica.AAC.2
MRPGEPVRVGRGSSRAPSRSAPPPAPAPAPPDTAGAAGRAGAAVGLTAALGLRLGAGRAVAAAAAAAAAGPRGEVVEVTAPPLHRARCGGSLAGGLVTEPRDSSMWKESSGSEAIEARDECDPLLSRRAEGPRPAESGAGASSSEELRSKALTFSRPAERAAAAPWKKLPPTRAGAAAEGPGPAAPCLWVGRAAAPAVGRATAGAAGAAAVMTGVRLLRAAAIRAGSALAAMGAIRAGRALLGAILCGMALLPALAAGAGLAAVSMPLSRAIRSLFSCRSFSSSDCIAARASSQA